VLLKQNNTATYLRW